MDSSTVNGDGLSDATFPDSGHEQKSDISLLSQRLTDALERGDVASVLLAALSCNADSGIVEDIIRTRWHAALTFMSSLGKGVTDQHSVLKRTRAAIDRFRVEADIAELLQHITHTVHHRRTGSGEAISCLQLDDSLLKNLMQSGHTQFKVCAVVGNKFYSVFDGRTEYAIGVAVHQSIQPQGKSGFFVHQSLHAALRTPFPRNSRLGRAPQAVLKVLCCGDSVDHGDGQLAYEMIVPVEVVCRVVY